MDKNMKLGDYPKQDWEYLIHGGASITKGAMVNPQTIVAAVDEYKAGLGLELTGNAGTQSAQRYNSKRRRV